jgi:transcriptional regulator of acetoin/glycerol metabolism
MSYINYKISKENVDKQLIIRMLRSCNGKINKTSKECNIPKKTLLRKMKLYNLNKEDFYNEEVVFYG